jgi:regulatory protein Rha
MEQRMNTNLEIILADGEHRVDCRLVAHSLGVEHKSFMRTIAIYQTKIEELGILRFQNEEIKGRGQPMKYTMLNENQAIFLATLSRNTEQVVDFKLKLTKAFSKARQHLPSPQPSIHTLTEQFRPRALENLRSVPEGYFSVMGELFKHLYNAEAMLNRSLDEHAMIEISVGQRWSRYARETLSIPSHLRRKYAHICQGGRVEQVWAYPIQHVTAFDKWLWVVYFPVQFSEYEQYRKQYLALPAPRGRSRQQKQLPAVQQQELFAS